MGYRNPYSLGQFVLQTTGNLGEKQGDATGDGGRVKGEGWTPRVSEKMQGEDGSDVSQALNEGSGRNASILGTRW